MTGLQPERDETPDTLSQTNLWYFVNVIVILLLKFRLGFYFRFEYIMAFVLQYGFTNVINFC